MTAVQWTVAYLGAAAVFLTVDLLWLGVVARDFYRRHLGGFLAEDVNWTAALVFYLLFIVGIFVFAVLPAAERDSARHALVMGALFGFFTYATYELTNLATMEGWPLSIVVVDIAWGAALTGTTSLAGFLFLRWMG